MDSEQQFILDCLNNSLKELPQVIYFDNMVSEAIKNITARDHVIVILSYFFQCHYCKKYFNDEDIKKCGCKEWCKFCIEVNTTKGRCSSCPESAIIPEYTHLTCIFKDCKEIADYGNIIHALYCRYHVYNHITVDHSSYCSRKKCYKTVSYINDDEYIRCDVHKNKNSKLFLREGYAFNNYSNVFTYCDVCKYRFLIVYKCCNCNVSRCYNCARLEVFQICSDNEYIGMYCCNCIGTYNFTGEVESSNIWYITDCTKCPKSAKYYDSKTNLQYCKTHKTSNCVEFDDMSTCKFEFCFALAVDKYCRFHTKLYNKFE